MQSIRNKPLLCCLGILWIVGSWLLPYTLEASTLFSPQDKQYPLEITAEQLEVDRVSKVSTFQGNVVVKKSDFIIHCDRLEVLLDLEKAPEHLAEKKGVPEKMAAAEVDTIYFYGSVSIEKQGKFAKGDRGIYKVGPSMLYLYDHVVLQEAGNTVKGEELIYDLKRDLATIQQHAGKHSGKDKNRVPGEPEIMHDRKNPDKVRAIFVPKKEAEFLKTH